MFAPGLVGCHPIAGAEGLEREARFAVGSCNLVLHLDLEEVASGVDVSLFHAFHRAPVDTENSATHLTLSLVGGAFFVHSYENRLVVRQG